MAVTETHTDDIRAVPSLEALYQTIDPMDLTPGWIPREVPLLTKEPTTPIRPNHWRYDQVKAALDAAGRLINTELAERRNLLLFNSPSRNAPWTAQTLGCAYQMILPGEKARSHRHSPHALRVILDAKGSFSIVDGEKTPMETGDVVLTPGSCWHGHGHDGDQPAYWFDGLDVPLTWLLEQVSFDEHPDGYETITRVAQDSPYRFSWDNIQRMLDRAAPDPEGYFATRVQLDASSMPTLGLYVQRLAAGDSTRPYRSTDHKVYVVMQGSGATNAGDDRFTWSAGDTFAVPGWHDVSLHAESDAVVFMMSDEPLMRFAKYWKFRPSE